MADTPISDTASTSPTPESTTDPATTAGTPDNPLSVTIVGGNLPGAPVFPTPGIDETVSGGAYRRQDGSWVDAENRPIKAPKGK